MTIDVHFYVYLVDDMYDCHIVQDGETALMLASANGHEECVRQLTDKAANVDATSNVSLYFALCVQ